MKNDKQFILSAIIGVSIGIGIGKKTKSKQREAKKEGKHIPYGAYEAAIKRPFDIVLAGTALIILSPIMGITALLVKTKLGAPVLFTQPRPGLNETIFNIYKYRTMTNEKDSNGDLLPDEKRLTNFGKWLRSTSLDELPELINILRGDMSIVGPRPLLVEYLERYDKKQKHRHDVRPGLTGYAQINGRNSLSWDEKFEDDINYIEKITFWRDLNIILKTIKMVFKKSGIHSETSATMETFIGNKDK